MYELKLIKGRSYTCMHGPLAEVHATAERPVVRVEDEATASAAVASGFFMLVSGPSENDGVQTDYSKLTLAELKHLAKKSGIPSAGLRTKADYIEALCDAEQYEGG